MNLFNTNENQKNNRVKELEKLILYHQKKYYSNEAEISDEEFDLLWDELKLLDSENDILKKIGSDLIDDKNYESIVDIIDDNEKSSSGTFEKAKHLIPMGSQEKAANPESFKAWAEKMNFDEFLVEYKLDGASLEMQYENGFFKKAVTRGDGIIGDDITNNALKMAGLVKELDDKTLTGGIRGEVVMFRDVHKKLYSDKANCRNAANGLMKRKDGEGCENLNIICYDARFVDANGSPSKEQPFDSEREKIFWLKKNGFTTVPICFCKGVDAVINYRAKIMEMRPSLEYNIDGLVIKGDEIDFEDADRNRPEKQIAFKFSLEEAVSILREVEWSESGATYTPVAIFDTVELAGTKVKRASLSNPDIIRELGIKIGSHIVVTKRGEIIPKIEYVLPSKNSEEEKSYSEIEFPKICSTCKTKLLDEGTRLYCPNPKCPKKVLHRLKKWISVLDIRDLGEIMITKLFESGTVKNIANLYELTEETLTPFFLNEESINREKKSLGATKVVQAIQAKRKISLAKFVAGLNIEGIGETLMEKLIDGGFDVLEKITSAGVEDISKVNFFGEITAQSLLNGLKECSNEIELLKEYVEIEKPQKEGKLSNLTFCFTGELFTMKRSVAENLVKENGGTVKNSVVKGLSYLVTNDKKSGSSKNKKAVELNIPVIDEQEFLKMLN
ncbi:MAG: NAD-dependent DNA ligase LigA [Treponema sp.]|nr:NAD-dependent DNA ligase LigA [Treponema sp.]